MGVIYANCGSENPQYSVFCKKCGTRIVEPERNPIQATKESAKVIEHKEAESTRRGGEANINTTL